MIEALQRDVGQWRAERDHATAQWEECCEDRSRQVAALREQLAEMTTSRDNFERLCKEWRIEFDAISAKKDDLQAELSQWQVGHDAVKEELAQAKEAADMFEAENTSLQDTVRQLRARQIHDDLPGLLKAIQAAAEQARELI
jgi:chromosome segregation ATPase